MQYYEIFQPKYDRYQIISSDFKTFNKYHLSSKFSVEDTFTNKKIQPIEGKSSTHSSDADCLLVPLTIIKRLNLSALHTISIN